MSLISSYLVTETVHRRKTGSGLRADTFDPERTIKTRWFPKTRTVASESGQEVVSDTTVQSLAKVKVGDTLRDEDGRDWPVISVALYQQLSGEVDFYESYL